jgi:hypothetical protein
MNIWSNDSKYTFFIADDLSVAQFRTTQMQWVEMCLHAGWNYLQTLWYLSIKWNNLHLSLHCMIGLLSTYIDKILAASIIRQSKHHTLNGKNLFWSHFTLLSFTPKPPTHHNASYSTPLISETFPHSGRDCKQNCFPLMPLLLPHAVGTVKP